MYYYVDFVNNKNTVKAIRSIENQNFLNKRVLEGKCYENAYVLPRKQIGRFPYVGLGGCLDSNRCFITESGDYDIPHDDTRSDRLFKFGGYYAFSDYEESNDEVIYGGLCHLHWGHFLNEGVQRLWYILNHDNGLPIVFCAFNNEKTYIWKDNFLKFFELSGIELNRIRIIYNPTRFRKVYVPEQSIWPGNWYTSEFKGIYDNIVSNVMKKGLSCSYEKIYLSRSHFKDSKSKEINSPELDSYLAECGFHIIYPEELTLEEQIYFYHEAKEICAISGTLTHNILFSIDRIKLIYLSKSPLPLEYQYTINALKDADVVWIDIYKNVLRLKPISLGSGPFLLHATKDLIGFLSINDVKINEKRIKNKVIIKYLMMYVETLIRRILKNIALGLSNYSFIRNLYYRLKMSDCWRVYKRKEDVGSTSETTKYPHF